MLPDMAAGYVLGSDTETITFARDGSIEYRPAGAAHAVDVTDPVNAHPGAVGYAICGRPVRVWPDQRFDPAHPPAHDGCIAAAQAAAGGRGGPGEPR